MPTYEYLCKACDEQFEVVQRFTDAPLTKCPKCGGPVRKVISAAGIIFKGSGFHVNDYPKSGAKSSSTETAATGSKS